MSPNRNAWLQIHFCVVLWGFTAILGKLISLPALQLVWWRMLLVVLVLLAIPRVWRGLRAMELRLIAAYAGVGVLVGLHWLAFYAAIKLANASVGATCMALAAVFLAFIEPLVMRTRFRKSELFIGIAAVPGVALVVGGIAADMRIGVLVGAVSALLAALFSAFNKRLVDHADPLTVTCIELGAGTAFLTLIAPLIPGDGALFALPGLHDAGLLLVLSLVCTLLPFALSLRVLRKLSAFGVQLTINLEPVYAIILAAWLLGEQNELSLRFYSGVAVILAAVMIYPLFNTQSTPPTPPAPELLGAAPSDEADDPGLT
ncbi:MAG: DMT family transporter [Dokdonella sp.]